MVATIGETIEQMRRSLRDYIEATYHISDPILIRQRARLLDEQGVIYQRPYLESTPRYVTGETFLQCGVAKACIRSFLSGL